MLFHNESKFIKKDWRNSFFDFNTVEKSGLRWDAANVDKELRLQQHVS